MSEETEYRQVIEIPPGTVAVQIVTGGSVRTINLPADCRKIVLVASSGGSGGAGGIGTFNPERGDSVVILGESQGGGSGTIHHISGTERGGDPSGR